MTYAIYVCANDDDRFCWRCFQVILSIFLVEWFIIRFLFFYFSYPWDLVCMSVYNVPTVPTVSRLPCHVRCASCSNVCISPIDGYWMWRRPSGNCGRMFTVFLLCKIAHLICMRLWQIFANEKPSFTPIHII